MTCLSFPARSLCAAGAKGSRATQVLAVVGAIAYSLTSYVTGYSSNIMWIDGVIMAPLACLGVYRLVRGRGCAACSRRARAPSSSIGTRATWCASSPSSTSSMSTHAFASRRASAPATRANLGSEANASAQTARASATGAAKTSPRALPPKTESSQATPSSTWAYAMLRR